MSVVGPRPERPFFVDQFRRDGARLHAPPQGEARGSRAGRRSTGHRGNTSLEKRIQYDIEYIERWSLWLDVKIIALTVVRIVFERNAY